MNDISFYCPPTLLLFHIIAFSLLLLFLPPSYFSMSYFRLRCDAQSTVVSAIETTYTTTDWSTILATDDETECSTQQETLVTALDATIGTTPFTPYNTAQ